MEIRDQIDEILEVASPEARNIVQELLTIEKKYLHMVQPRGIHDEIVDMISREVQSNFTASGWRTSVSFSASRKLFSP